MNSEKHNIKMLQSYKPMPLQAFGPAGSKGRLVDEGLPMKRECPANSEDGELIRQVRIIIERLREEGKISPQTVLSGKAGHA